MSPDIPLILAVDVAPRINLAWQLNGFSPLRQLELHNQGGVALQGLVVEMTCDPPLIAPRTWRLEQLDPQQAWSAQQSELKLELPAGDLAQRSEAEPVTLTFMATATSLDPVLCRLQVEVLPRNHWSGLSPEPLILAAFAEPNDPAIDRLLASVATLLEQSEGLGGLDGYAGGAARVWSTAAALYKTIQTRGVQYALPPASFVSRGQKIRPPSDIMANGVATCLDTSMLFAAALEQAGLDPLVIVPVAHAFVGLWLRPDCYDMPVLTDPSELRNRIALNELLVFETTCVTGPQSFSSAIDTAKRLLDPEHDPQFLAAIDLRRARHLGVRPIASRSSIEPLARAKLQEASAASSLERPPEILTQQVPGDDLEPDHVYPPTPAGRLDRWKSRLLDLTLRNPLLNHRGERRSLPLVVPNLPSLEDRLASGTSFALVHNPLRNAVAEGRITIDPATLAEQAKTLSEHEVKRKRLMVDLTGDEAEDRQIKLFRDARTQAEETGATVLYLALGFLLWCKPGQRDRRYRAPLLLVPVEMQRKGASSEFSLRLKDEDPQMNPTLDQLLQRDVGIALPFMDELPRDKDGIDLEAVFRETRLRIRNQPGFELVQDAAIGLFSFAKHLMWRDLRDHLSAVQRNPLARQMLEGAGAPPLAELKSDLPLPEDLDSIPAADMFCPLPADGSQLAAVQAAAAGQSFVLIGPPGTGKSQTITNMIAQSLATNRTVLFVSEKRAALEVVYQRLKQLNLHNFCLELHSNKAEKKAVLSQLSAALAVAATEATEEWRSTSQGIQQARDRLNGYVRALHRIWPNGFSVFQAISRHEADRSVAAPVIDFTSLGPLDHQHLDSLRGRLRALDVAMQAVEGAPRQILANIGRTEWSIAWQQGLRPRLSAVIDSAATLSAALSDLAEPMDLPLPSLRKEVRPALRRLLQDLPELAARPLGAVLRPRAHALLARLQQEALPLLERHQALTARLGSTIGPEARLRLTQALEQLKDWVTLRDRLGATWRLDAVEALDLTALATEAAALPGTGWPWRNLRLKKLRRSLTPALVSPVPSPETEIAKLQRFVALKAALTETQSSLAALCPAWAGPQTTPLPIQTFVQFDEVLERFLAHGTVNQDAERALQARLQDLAGSVEGRTMLDRLECLRDLAQVQAALMNLDGMTRQSDGLWRGLKTDPKALHKRLLTAVRLRQDLDGAYGPLPQLAVSQALHAWRQGGKAAAEAVREPCRRVQSALDQFESAAAALQQELDWAGAEPLQAMEPEEVAGLAEGLLGVITHLREWCACNAAIADIKRARLKPIFDWAMETDPRPDRSLEQVFDLAYLRWWLPLAIDSDPVLRGFAPRQHKACIEDLRRLDEQHRRLAVKVIRAQLAQRLKGLSQGKFAQEMAVLNREIQKQRKHLPIRTLISQIPNCLPRLTPCLLMSPLSIAQYLPPEGVTFDVIIFDEASQITPWDAIGALARGRQVIMVGDPRQMPPSNFFSRQDSDEDASIHDDDQESVLDECLGSSIPRRELTWHYRSRHESLIAFSNNRYYEDNLVTFPSPVKDDRAVSFHKVDGLFESGRSRTNRAEAEALVADVIRALRSGDAGQDLEDRASIGVVTFNAPQQKLIQDLLDAERRRNPELEPYFAEDRREPVFVKNLENVQGDERNLIYFSITYAPSSPGGPLNLSLGPLNRKGGERRLNVAVTRGRLGIRVFSSITAEQIDLTRSGARGIHDLRLFLDYAERGAVVLTQVKSTDRRDSSLATPFESQLAAALRAKGWEVIPQVGVSGFRIDLGVLHPARPGSFLAGIETDGVSYHRASSARDRDLLREQVLRSLGWTVLRVWSMDWYLDPETVVARLHASLQELSAVSSPALAG